MLMIDVAVAKVSKYASQESGDTLEMIERPRGGLSFVLADGQGSGRAAKAISNLVAKKAIALLAEGVRDGAAARGSHDVLYAYRQGKVSADLIIVSFDLATSSLVISQNSHCPLIIARSDGLTVLDKPSQPVGIHARTKPVVSEMPLAPGLTLIVVTDGIVDAGQRYGARLDLPSVAEQALQQNAAQSVADDVLAQAMALDHGRPQDDMSVLVLRVLPGDEGNTVRRLHVSFPV